ncbi:MAG: hypothetical protein HY272_11855 [Gammaproteobacteria bacterium]|nr:hypothetical protein [Gammaproteobacteria bacterium]
MTHYDPMTISENERQDSLAHASALLALADQVLMHHDVLNLEGEANLGLSIVIGEAKRLIREAGSHKCCNTKDKFLD